MTKPSKIRFSETTPLKREPLFGVFLRWPEDGEDWIHPLDIGVARFLLPGHRVFRRDEYDQDYYVYSYGNLSFRAKPRMWLLVEHEGFDVDDCIEIKSQMGKNWPMLATVKQVVWNHYSKQINYHLETVGRKKIDRAFVADQIQPIQALHRSAEKLPGRLAPLNSVANFFYRPKSD